MSRGSFPPSIPLGLYACQGMHNGGGGARVARQRRRVGLWRGVGLWRTVGRGRLLGLGEGGGIGADSGAGP
jgi:hypothetical protein